MLAYAFYINWLLFMLYQSSLAMQDCLFSGFPRTGSANLMRA
jgi:hypothetical protein